MKRTLRFVESLFTPIRRVKNKIRRQNENSKVFSNLNINSFVQRHAYNTYDKDEITHNTQDNMLIITFFSFYKLYL